MPNQAVQKNSANPSPTGANLQQLRAELKSHTEVFFGTAVAPMMTALDEALFEWAGNSPSNTEQQAVLEGMKAFRGNAKIVEQDFLATLVEEYDAYFALAQKQQSENEQGEISAEHLQLVDDADFEDELAVSIMASRAEEEHIQAIWSLDQRMSVLRGSKGTALSDNPLGPVTIARSMQNALQKVDVATKVRLRAYEQFEQSVLSDIGKFLEEANTLLAGKGVLPDLKYSPASGTTGSAPSSAANEDQAEAQVEDILSAEDLENYAGASSLQAPGMSGPQVPGTIQNWDAPLRNEQAMLDALVRWHLDNLSVSRTGVTSYGVDLGSLFSAQAPINQRFTHEDYVSVLNTLQGLRKEQLQTGVNDISSSVVDFQQEFVGELNTLASTQSEDKKVDAGDAGTIDLVGLIFNELIADEHLPNKVKALLSLMHTPYMKIALIDGEFLGSPEHPARQLLNELSEAGSAWVTEDKDDFKVYEKIYQVVHRTIDDFDSNLDFIEMLREDFAKFTDRLESRVELAEKRTAQAEEGRDKVEVARARAELLIERRANAKALPQEAVEVLQPCWLDFLVFVYLRFSIESEQWRQAVMLMNQAFVRVHAALLTDESTLAATVKQIEKIDQQISQGILKLGYDEHGVEKLIASTERASAITPNQQWVEKHERRSSANQQYTGRDINPDLPEDNLEEDIKLDFKITDLEDSLSEQEQEVRETLREIDYGTWFEWLDDAGKVEQKLKLAWYSAMSGNYMFVNHAGVKVLVETLNDLAIQVQQGKVRIVNAENKSFMERVFSRIVDNIQTSV